MKAARAYKRIHPHATAEQLKQHLEEKFVFPSVPRLLATSATADELGLNPTMVGNVSNPLDWFTGLSKIARVLIRMYLRGKPSLKDAYDIIDAVVIIVG